MSQLPATSYSRSGEHKGPETYLTPSADQQTGEGDINEATGILIYYMQYIMILNIYLSS